MFLIRLDIAVRMIDMLLGIHLVNEKKCFYYIQFCRHYFYLDSGESFLADIGPKDSFLSMDR